LKTNEEDERPDEFYELLWEAIGEHQHILWEGDCRGDVELYDETEMQEAEFNKDGTPKKNIMTSW